MYKSVTLCVVLQQLKTFFRAYVTVLSSSEELSTGVVPKSDVCHKVISVTQHR